MKKLISILTIATVFITSCAVKKEKSSAYKSCDEYFSHILNKQQSQNKPFKVYSYVYVNGKHLFMKGKFNKYGGGTIRFYLPIGTKVATVEKHGEEFCIKNGEDCKKVNNPFRNLGISVEKVLTKNYSISKNDTYTCSDSSLIVEKPGFSLVYKDGELKSVLLSNILIKYEENQIFIYDMGQLIAQFEIKKIIYER